MKILIVPFTHTLSHVSRPLLIAEELRDRGHEVVFAGESSKIIFIKDKGFRVLPLHEPDPDLLYRNIRKGKLKFVADSEIEQMIEADLTLYLEANPDVVLTDGRFSAPISTHIAGLRHVAIVNVSSTEHRALPYIPLFAWLPDSLIKRDTFLWQMLDFLNLKLEMFVFDNVMNCFKKLSKKYKLQKTITATNCLCGKDITLLADIPEYFPTKNLPRDYHYIGPLTWKANVPPPAWWPPKRSHRPFLYITMGTTGIPDFFFTVYKLLKASDMQAIITTGAQVQGLQTINQRIFVESFIDGDMAMEKCSLVVCHGGNGTIYQALQHGKPIIGIPTIPDQRFNMRRVKTLGLGRALSQKEFSGNPAILVELIKSVLSEKSFYRNAEKFRKILCNYNAVKTAADIILM